MKEERFILIKAKVVFVGRQLFQLSNIRVSTLIVFVNIFNNEITSWWYIIKTNIVRNTTQEWLVCILYSYTVK